jgi:hypothetical protein
VTLPRACLGPPGGRCPQGQLVRGRPRCQGCARAHELARGSRQHRGYDREHDALRAQLVAALDPWAPCPRCGDPLGPDPARLDLMHRDDRQGWLGLGHARCNRDVSPISAGQRTPRQPESRLHIAAVGPQ